MSLESEIIDAATSGKTGALERLLNAHPDKLTLMGHEALETVAVLRELGADPAESNPLRLPGLPTPRR